MATLLIRKLDDRVKARLRVRAAQHGRSLEAEAREIIQQAVAKPDPDAKNLGRQIHARFALLGGLELAEIPQEFVTDPDIFGE